MTTTEIREALTEVQHAVEIPPVDQLAFRARVRAERRRHVASRAVLAGAAAAVLAAGAVSVAHLVDGGQGRDVPVASGAPESGGRVVSETVWFVRNGRLTALDPSGEVHDLGLRSEGVVGWTSERVYAVDAESHVVVLGRETDHEGLGKDTAYPREDSPVAGAVQSAALSAEGRYLAWLDLDDTVTVYDLVADRVDFRVDVPRSSYVAAVSGDGVLVSEDVDLVLHTASGETAVPTQEAGDNWGAQLTMGRVLVVGAVRRVEPVRPEHGDRRADRRPARWQTRAGDVRPRRRDDRDPARRLGRRERLGREDHSPGAGARRHPGADPVRRRDHAARADPGWLVGPLVLLGHRPDLRGAAGARRGALAAAMRTGPPTSPVQDLVTDR